MPSRRRSRSKNLTNNLADVQRRLRFLERRPVRTKLANRVVTRAAIAPNSVSADEAEFGTSVVVPPGEDIEDVKSEIENPKEGFLVVDATTGESQIYSETQETYYDVSDPVAQVSADAAADAAALAAANAALAQQTADGKNKVFRSASQPTTGPFAEGDIWFDTDDDNKIYRYTSGSWNTAIELGNNALASIAATKITAGTLAAGVVYAGSITAGQITAGNISADRISANVITAVNLSAALISANKIGAGTITASIEIQGPTITGGTIRTSPLTTDRRIEISASDDIAFYKDGAANARVGTITGVGSGWTGGGDDVYNIPSNDGIMIYGGSVVASQGEPVYPSIVATSTNVYMYGGNGSARFQVGNLGPSNEVQIGIYGTYGNYYTDFSYIFSGYSSTIRPDGSTLWWGTYMNGRLVWSENQEGPLSAGTGAPSTAGKYTGQICFRY